MPGEQIISPIIDVNHIKELAKSGKIKLDEHARIRTIQRNATARQAADAIIGGDLIREYVDDYPPIADFLCHVDGERLKVTVIVWKDSLVVKTVYWIDFEEGIRIERFRLR